MKATFHSVLFSSAAAVALMAGSAAASTLDVTVGGRIDFTASISDSLNDGAITNGGVTAGASDQATFEAYEAAYADDTENSGDLGFGTAARFDVNVGSQTELFEYGGFMRIDLSPSTGTVSDTDAHLYFNFNLGSLKMGTDIDAFQGAFDTDKTSVGPISPLKTVQLPLMVHQFDTYMDNTPSVVYTSPSFNGFTVAAELDDDSDFGASLAYAEDFGGYNIEGAVAVDDGDTVGGFGRIGAGDWAFSAFAGRDDDKDRYLGLGVSHSLGAITLSADYSSADVHWSNSEGSVEADERQIAFGASMDIADGLSVAGSVAGFSRNVETVDYGATVSAAPANLQQELDGIRTEGRLRLAF